MSNALFRLLAIGYGLAALGAVALWLSGVGALAAGLTFWIGGAAAVLAVAAIQTRGGSVAAATSENLVREEELMRWEQDRRRDAPPAAEGAKSLARQIT